MSLKEKGKYWELPIITYPISKIIYNGLIRLEFNDDSGSYLDIHGEFIVTRFNQTFKLDPRSKESYVFLFDLFNATVIEAKADKYGNLFLIFDNNVELTIEDGPYENWHYTKIDKTNTMNNIFVHGGVGYTSF